MPFISQSSIQEVTDRLDAITLVSEYLRLEKKSGRYWACCPFHQEKTASFTVNPDLKTYYCFGCHKGGSLINFVMEMDKLSFPEAVELLAKKCSLELVYESSSGTGLSAADEDKKKAKEDLFELYKRISGTFHHFLLEKEEAASAKQYIINRGISAEMIKAFSLGYTPADRSWLYKFLSQKGYSREFLASSGLFSSRHPQSALFSGRLMFPISDRQGRVVAFGGRHISAAKEGEAGTSPKYINSPELGIYKKGETLFGLDLALAEIRRTKTAYIAEGYLDVIALHQAGLVNAVAPLGTAFTDEQAKLLRRWAESAILFFDSDAAGQAAAIKAVYTCRKNGLNCALIAPGEPEDASAKDPAAILEQHGLQELNKIAKCFINDFDYLLLRAAKAQKGETAQGKARAVAFVFPYLDLLDSEVARDSCFKAIADNFGLPVKAVADDYRRHTRGAGKKEEGQSRQAGGKSGSPIRMNDELSLLIVVALNYVSSPKEKFFTRFRSAFGINEIEDPNAKEIFIALEECIRYGETTIEELLARILSPELKKFIVERTATQEFSINPERLAADGIKKIRGRRLERRQEEIIIKLRSIKKAGVEVHELLAEKMRIDNELYLLKQGRQA